MSPKPVQKPLPIWMGVGHPDAVRRAAELADGWMGSGGSSIAAFRRIGADLARTRWMRRGRDPANFPISKRIFMAVDESPEVARAELHRWFTEVYHNPPGTDASRHPRHAGAGARAARGAGRDGRQPSDAQPGLPLCRAGRSAGRGRRVLHNRRNSPMSSARESGQSSRSPRIGIGGRRISTRISATASAPRPSAPRGTASSA